MGWFSDLISNVKKKETIDFYVSNALPLGTAAISSAPVSPDSYITVRVASLRLPNTRQKVFEKVYGVVHVFAGLKSRFGNGVEFASATMPNKLAGVDPKNLGNLLTIDKNVVGPTPWSGGDFNLQIGLFSVISENLAGAFLGTLTKLTETVGVAFAATAKPYADVLQFGIEKLTGTEGSVKLEIGADKSWTPPMTGHFALVASPHNALATRTLSIDPNDKKLLVDGKHYTDKPYVIYSIESTAMRSDWGDIPDLKTSYESIRQAIISNDRNKAEELLKVFARLAAVSPDLIAEDARVLVAKAELVLKQAFSGAETAGMSAEVLPFEKLGLYEGRELTDAQ